MTATVRPSRLKGFWTSIRQSLKNIEGDWSLASFANAGGHMLIVTLMTTLIMAMAAALLLGAPLDVTIGSLLAEACRARVSCDFYQLLPAFGIANIILLYLLIYSGAAFWLYQNNADDELVQKLDNILADNADLLSRLEALDAFLTARIYAIETMIELQPQKENTDGTEH